MSGAQPYFLAGVLLAAFAATVVILKPFFTPLILAAVFAVVAHPIFIWLKRRFSGYDSLAAVATLVIVAIFILAPLSALGIQILAEALDLYDSLSENHAGGFVVALPPELIAPLQAYFPIEEQFDLAPYVTTGLDWLLDHADTIFSGITRTVLGAFIFLVALYYLMRDGGHFTKVLIAVSPLADRDDEFILAKLHAAVNSVLKGNLMVALIQGGLTGFGFWIFGVPNALLWGSVAAIAALVPALGTALIITPAVLFLLWNGMAGSAIGLAAWGGAAVGLVDNILGPRLMGRGINMHPLLMLLSVLGGLGLFGPIGFLVGPLVVSLFLALLDIYNHRKMLLS